MVRIVQTIPTLLIVTAAVFTLTRLAPGDPVLLKLGNQALLPGNEQMVERMRAELGLDQSLFRQYLTWLSDLSRGDLGTSLTSREPVRDLILARLPATIQLMVATMVLALLVGVPMGIFAALHPGGWIDRLFAQVTALGLAVPMFWLALVLILAFSVQWQLLPPSGYVPITEDPVASLQRTILPAVALAIREGAIFAKFVRAEMQDVLGKDYIRVARSKGLGTWGVVRGHALKNTMIPLVTVIGVEVGALMGGVVVVEQVFGWSGIGWQAVQGLLNRDYAVVAGVVLLTGAVYVLINTVVDLTYGMLDPRARAW